MPANAHPPASFPEDVITFVSHPWREDAPLRRWSLVGAMVAASAVAGFGFGGHGIGLGAFGVLFLSLSRYFLPTFYEVNPRGVHARHLGVTRFHPWARFKRVALRRDGVFLSTFPRPTHLDAWRGLFVRASGNREQVYAFARAHISLEAPPRERQLCPGNASPA